MYLEDAKMLPDTRAGWCKMLPVLPRFGQLRIGGEPFHTMLHTGIGVEFSMWATCVGDITLEQAMVFLLVKYCCK